jgi:hypothetical protein
VKSESTATFDEKKGLKDAKLCGKNSSKGTEEKQNLDATLKRRNFVFAL